MDGSLEEKIKYKTIKVVITKTDGNDKQILELEGKDAQIWGETVEQQAVFCHIHGTKFPELNWQVTSEESLTFDTYQKESKRTAIYPNVGTNYIYPVLGLTGEAGEVANIIKKIQRDCNGIIIKEHKDRIKKELGDCIWYCAQIASELNLLLEEIASENLKKLFSRMKRGTLRGSGDDR